MKKKRIEIRLAGAGGQGIILGSIILAEAAGIHDGRYVSQTESYGAEVRGGASKAEVIISQSPIDYPMAVKLDVLLAMNQVSCDAYFMDLKPDGLLIVDSTYVKQVPTNRYISIPFTDICRERLGISMLANIMALGSISVLSGAVSIEGLKWAVENRLKGELRRANLRALDEGVKEANKIDLQSLPRTVYVEEEEI